MNIYKIMQSSKKIRQMEKNKGIQSRINPKGKKTKKRGKKRWNKTFI